MSCNKQETFQILNILTSSLYLWNVAGLVLIMEKKPLGKGFFSKVMNGFFTLLQISLRDVGALFAGETISSGRKASQAESFLSFTGFVLACLSFSFYWASVGLNLTNGSPNAFTTVDPNMQGQFIAGTILVAFVFISFWVSFFVHWGMPFVKKCFTC